MDALSLGEFHFTTDGSVVKEAHCNRAWIVITSLSLHQSYTLANFINETMPWIRKSSDIKELQIFLPEALYTYYQGMEHKDLIPINMDSLDDPELLSSDIVPSEDLDVFSTIMTAMHPFFATYSPDSICDRYYTSHVYWDHQALSSRNYKELITQCFGGYSKKFPYLNHHKLSLIKPIADLHPKTSIDVVSRIAQFVKDEFCPEMDYLPYTLSSEEINLSPLRLLNWLESYSAKDVFFTIAHLSEVASREDIPTISSRGNMHSVRNRAEELLLVPQRNNNFVDDEDRLVSVAPSRVNNHFLKDNEYNDQKLKTAPGYRVNDLQSPVTTQYGEYSVYLLRSAIDIQALANKLDICLDKYDHYLHSYENDICDLYLLDDGERQFVAEISHSPRDQYIQQIRGYRNCLPNNEEPMRIMENIMKQSQEKEEKLPC